MAPWRRSTGASSTMMSSASGARAANSSAFWWPLNRLTEENMTAPRMMSATMLSTVWDTTVPSTTGRFSRGRPVRRATTSARDGSPSRAGSVEDMSTPMNVPCIASDRRTLARGSAALQDRVPREGAHDHRAAHDRKAQEHEGGARGHERLGDLADPDLLQGQDGEHDTADAHRTPRPARRAMAIARLPVLPSLGCRLGRRWAGTRGLRSAARRPTRTAARCMPGSGSGVAIASS